MKKVGFQVNMTLRTIAHGVCFLLAIPVFGQTGDCCDQGGDKVNSFTFEYTGQSCNATNTSQQSNKFDCDDNGSGPNGDASVYIRSTEKDDGGGDLFFQGQVNLGETFTAIATEDDFPSRTYHFVYSSQGGTLLQVLEVHASCSAPVVIGDQFGSLILRNATFKNGFSCGPPTPPETCPEPEILIDNAIPQGNTTVCKEDPVVFSTDQPECSEVILTWNFGAGASPQTASGPGPHTVSYSNTGNRTVQLNANNDCEGGKGTTVCTAPPGPNGFDCCDSGDKPDELTLIYTGEGCNATNISQSSNKYGCSGDPNSDPSVYIIVSEDPNGGGKVFLQEMYLSMNPFWFNQLQQVRMILSPIRP